MGRSKRTRRTAGQATRQARFAASVCVCAVALVQVSQAQSLWEAMLPPEAKIFARAAALRDFIRSEAPAFRLNFRLDDSTRLERFPLPARLFRSGTLDAALARDALLTDVVYLKALALARGDLREALLIATAGCMTHKAIPLKFFGVSVPLTLEADSLFAERRGNLPRRLFSDTPANAPFGDADKLQHFFGAAWLALVLDNERLAETLGSWIETLEAALVRGEPRDERDLRANALGAAFARRLWDEPRALPAATLLYWSATGKIPETP